MLDLHKAAHRGTTRLDWLESRHGFSFGAWFDPARVGFRTLRVLNDDRVAPGAGFGPHPHRDMEILTVVLAGRLEHRDSSGVRTLLGPGDVQRMSAGRGVVHSEWNASETEELRFLQIWLRPATSGLAPSHEEGRGLFPTASDAPAGLRTLASAAGEDGAVTIHQDARVLAGRAAPGALLSHRLAPGRGAWIQAVRGGLSVNDVQLAAGDGLAVEDEAELLLSGGPEGGDFLLFDLA
ncbi:MAG: pirin family protein [Myxococcota bacterium]|nr:pirin family protein [Myxococcota bacterium]